GSLLAHRPTLARQDRRIEFLDSWSSNHFADGAAVTPAILYNWQSSWQFKVNISHKCARFFQNSFSDACDIKLIDLIDRYPVQIFQFSTGNERLSVKFRYMIAKGDKKTGIKPANIAWRRYRTGKIA